MKRRDFAIGLGALGLSGAVGVARAAAGDWRDAAARAWSAATGGTAPAIGRSDAFLVLLDGKVAFERYSADPGPDVRHISWSMCKSVTQALAGVAVVQGRLNIDAPLVTWPHPGLTLRHLLTLTDGLKWDEGDYDPAASDATRMLYGPGRFDGAAYVGAKPSDHTPGARWNYSTGAYQLAAAEIQARLFPEARTPEARRRTMSAWMRRSLFDPIGMASAQPEFDAAGTFVGGSLLYATARDYARFGELYRLDGVWRGRRILPEGWVKFARTPTVEASYGAGFWLEAPADHKPASLLGGAGPMDAFAAEGHEGQVILIIPSKSAVVVRLGLMPDEDGAWKALGAWLLPVVNALGS
ncbi:MAG: serine hydrolase [Caulobacteraceae bacterium]